MKKLIIIVAVLVIVVGGVYAMTAGPLRGLAQGTPAPTPAAAKPIKLNNEIVAEGRVLPIQSAELAFQGSGLVAEVALHEGQRVEQGQVIAQLERVRLESALAEAAANQASAEARLAETQAGATEEDVAAADAAVALARAQVQTADGGVANANANLDRVQAGPSAEELTIAERRVEVAKNALWGYQALRDSICGHGRSADCDNAKANVQRGEEKVRIAQLQLQDMRSRPRPEEVAAAHALLEQAQGQRATAQAQVAKAEADAARAKKGATPDDVALAESQVEQAHAGVERTKASLADAELRAPFAGTIVTIEARQGEFVSAGKPVVRVADLGRWQVQSTDVTELNAVRIQVGAQVTITLDALPGVAFPGHVERIRALGELSRGDIVYTVVVAPDVQDPRWRWNMTAALRIATQ